VNIITDPKKLFLKGTYYLTINEDLTVTEPCLYTIHIACLGQGEAFLLCRICFSLVSPKEQEHYSKLVLVLNISWDREPRDCLVLLKLRALNCIGKRLFTLLSPQPSPIMGNNLPALLVGLESLAVYSVQPLPVIS